GYAIGNRKIDFFSQEGVIIKTTDGGASWTLNETFDDMQLSSVLFTQPDVGFITSAGGLLSKTDNGGISWTTQVLTPEKWWLYDIHFVNETTGFIAAAGGNIFKTYDGGASWHTNQTSTKYDFISIDFGDENTGIAVGRYIFKTTNGGGYVSIEANENNVYQLHIYPNPSNEFVTIDLRETLTTEGALFSIYNMQGQLIFRQNLSESKTTIDVSGFPDGIYIIKIYHSQNTSTSKIIKL
ncbi:MAG: T9SS type A sorting domain-containing protein, partial [Bacteroidetes bacterium]|nr:T9SS type A sorting domain-containing protein [Bacteroidota bacterium]